MSTDPALQQPPQPRAVLVIAGVLVVESVALVVLAVASILTIFTATPLSVGASVFMAVLLVMVGGGLAVLAARLTAGFRWPRSPALVVQLFLVILAFPYFSTGSPLVGFLLMVPAAVVIVLLFSRRVLDFTVRTTTRGRTL